MAIKLRTDWVLESGERMIDHRSKILLIGSCFSDHISAKMKLSGFDVLDNPHGIVFHPLAIERSLTDCISRATYTKEDLVFNGEAWASLNHHGRFNHKDPEIVLESIHSSIRKANSFLSQTTHLILTLGTSWVYKHHLTNTYVTNCHKIPQKKFEKVLLRSEEISESLEHIVSSLKKANPGIAIILTVSPVRHIKDGIVENTLSKARLHEAVQHLVTTQEHVSYFPSYEIMMDDLRDYRFYKSDLIHPNETAVDYIWEKFVNSWINPSAFKPMKEAQSIHRALGHRPLQIDSTGLRTFREKTEKQILDLEEIHPEVKIYRD